MECLHALLLIISLITASSGCQYGPALECPLKNGTTVSVIQGKFCCDGQLLPMVGKHGEQCCCHDKITGNETVYDPDENICCLGGMFPAVDNDGQRQRCCGNDPHNPRNSLCCNPGPLENNYGAVLYETNVGQNDECCSHEKINTDNQVCCRYEHNATEAYSYDKDSRKQCCDTAYYNPETDNCVDNPTTGRFDVRPKFIEPCGNITVDTRTHSCCNGRAQANLPGVESSSIECCGQNLINKDIHKCCNNVYSIDVNMRCCGTQPPGINPQTQRCCDHHPRNISHNTDECCGSEIMDTKIQDCCHGESYNNKTHKACRGPGSRCRVVLKTDSCCGSEKLEQHEVCCKAGTDLNYVFFTMNKTKSSDNKCCSPYNVSSRHGIPYSHQTEDCVTSLNIPQVAPKQNLPKCGHTYYNETIDLCCYGNFFPNAVLEGKECCSYKIYDPVTQSCCPDMEVYDSISCPVRCGRRMMDISKHRCCGGVPNKNVPNTECCGTSLFWPSVQSCCDSEVVYSPSCKKEEHPICPWLCSQNEKTIRREIRRGKIDICKTNGYIAKVSHKNQYENVTRLVLSKKKERLFNDQSIPVKVRKLFLPTCPCQRKRTIEHRKNILVLTDQSIREKKVDLKHNRDYVLPYTKKVRKTLMKNWKHRCNNPVNLVTKEVVDEIFDFIKVKIEKQQQASFKD